MEYADLAFHNVAELVPAAGTDLDLDDGRVLTRIPDGLRAQLNNGAQRRYRHPAGVEIRFVGGVSEPVELTLSATDPSTVEIYWGPFHDRQTVVGPDPTTLTLQRPELLGRLRPEVVSELAFDPAVCRVRLAGAHRGGVVAFHGVSGRHRPPRTTELPSIRYLAYGTSITEGEAPSVENLAYVQETARRLGADLRNLGVCGSAYVEPELAEYIATESFDVASLALSVNMIDAFTVETFRTRAEHMVRTVATAHPETPIVAVSLYPYYDDILADGDREKATAFRNALADAVASVDRDNLVLLEGPDLLNPAGLRTDLLHPADAGMITVGERLADELASRLAA